MIKNNSEADDVREMDAFFRREFPQRDFAAENPGLEKRLWQKIQEKIARRKSESPVAEIDEERELTSEELSGLAAAGANDKLPDALKKIIESIGEKP